MHLCWTRMCTYRPFCMYRPIHDTCVALKNHQLQWMSWVEARVSIVFMCFLVHFRTLASSLKSFEMFGAHEKFFGSFWNHCQNHIHIHPPGIHKWWIWCLFQWKYPCYGFHGWQLIIMRSGRAMGHSNGGISRSFGPRWNGKNETVQHACCNL